MSLLLSRHLLIRVAPGTDFQAAAHPAELFRALRPGQRGAYAPANRAAGCNCRPLRLYRFFRQLQNLWRDDWLRRLLLFHSRLHYRTDRPRSEPALVGISKSASSEFSVHSPRPTPPAPAASHSRRRAANGSASIFARASRSAAWPAKSLQLAPYECR